MNKEALELFTSNYECKGICEGLDKGLKEFKKGITISYLPWAKVERLFRIQGGSIEIVNWNMAIENTSLVQEANENGEVVKVEKTQKALMLHLKGTWMGEELEEFYPITGNDNKPLTNPNNMQYNNAKQRGMVKLVARLSGIGLKLFEDGDLQFEETKEDEIPNLTPKKTTQKKKVVTPIDIDEVIEKPQVEDPMAMFLGEEPKEEVVTPKVEETKVEPTKVTYSQESEEYADLKLKVISYKASNQQDIVAYIKSKSKSALNQLTYEEMEDLLKQLEG